jgi:hypothetical protein
MCFKFVLLVSGIILTFASNVYSQDKIERKDIEVHFQGDAKIEVGNHYIGTEFHHSFPIPQRISFFYPVANSIDLSSDYWKRDSTFVMALGIKEEEKDIEWINDIPFEFNLTPYSVAFTKSDSIKTVNIFYNFCMDKPAMVMTIEIINVSDEEKEFSVFTNLETSLKTSHTYNLKDKAWTEFEESTNTLYTNFNDIETQNAVVFVSNADEKPVDYKGKSSIKNLNDVPRYWWREESLQFK